MDCSPPGSSVHGIFQARLEWVTISFSRRSSQPRDWTQVSRIVGRRFTVWATREVFIGLQWEFIYLFIAISRDTWDLNSPTRIRTWTPYIKSIESSHLPAKEVAWTELFCVFVLWEIRRVHGRSRHWVPKRQEWGCHKIREGRGCKTAAKVGQGFFATVQIRS